MTMASPVETIKRVPPMVWLIGGAVVIGVVVLKSGASSGGGGGVSSAGGGGGGGGDRDELDNLAQGFVDLVEEVRAQADEDAAWRTEIEARLADGAPTNPNPAPSTPTKVKSVWGSDIPQSIRSRFSNDSIKAVMKKQGISYGTTVNISDLKAALKKEGINYGATVNYQDLQVLFKRTGVKPVKPTAAKP